MDNAPVVQTPGPVTPTPNGGEAAKKKRIVIAEVEDFNDEQGNPAGVRWTFSDGFVSEVPLSSFSPLIVAKLAVHGLKQKATDVYSGAGKLDNGLAVAKAAHLKVIDQLREGDFSRSGKGGTTEEPLEALIDAFAQALAARPDTPPPDKDKIRQRLTSGEDGGRAARAMVRKIPEVTAILARKPSAPSLDAVADWG